MTEALQTGSLLVTCSLVGGLVASQLQQLFLATICVALDHLLGAPSGMNPAPSQPAWAGFSSRVSQLGQRGEAIRGMLETMLHILSKDHPGEKPTKKVRIIR